MIAYVHRLGALDPARSLVSPAPRAVVLLSGRSLFNDCHLRPQQLEFLKRVAPPGVRVIPAQFPYHRDMMTALLPEPHILIASWRNMLQYTCARLAPSFRRLVARHLQVVFDSCERVTVITGSSGLALLESARAHLTLRSPSQLRVIALGPVIWCRPTIRHLTVIRGDRDWISRALAPVTSDYVVAGGHMDYYTNPHVARVVRTVCERHFAF